MARYLQLFINLCLFRHQAQDVPRSEALLFATAALAVITSAINAVPNAGLFRGMFMSIGQVLLFALLISLLLRFRSLSERSTQTLTAMFGWRPRCYSCWRFLSLGGMNACSQMALTL
ncbi:MAG: hypothetical protein ACJ0TD_02800 [Arenicellales bacterium]